ncbi:hypothetical protein JDV02_005106 [Purpureocillium takamizusanense]|uniref:Uncharacterized protein n=1 Tax=Purpureocillium takamizusanense TaxID=2060973 RepID=A0A9Q8QGM8_9HYPO|nr:uncharacterized protein JDV02_005106 [Purpureocillium takamizusanense]UNI18866.1 hypothetical protein JDV02_005106 [Purpureocillium takamizusanense]
MPCVRLGKHQSIIPHPPQAARSFLCHLIEADVGSWPHRQPSKPVRRSNDRPADMGDKKGPPAPPRRKIDGNHAPVLSRVAASVENTRGAGPKAAFLTRRLNGDWGS